MSKNMNRSSNTKESRNRLWLILLTLILLLAMALGGCGADTDNGDDNGGHNGEDNNVDANELVTITDELGLTSVEIQDGKATVFFHPEVWEQYEDETKVLETAEVYFPSEGSFPVNTIGERVAFGMVEQVKAMGSNFMSDEFTMPSLYLAMEDGSVEWLQLNPFTMYPGDEFYSIMALPFLEDIVAFSFENDGEGFGEMTVYAEAKNGLHYDVRLAHKYADFFEGFWSGTVEMGEDEFYVYMIFGKNGLMKMGQSRAYADDWGGSYSGTYTLHMDEEASKDYLPGMISIDVELESGQRLNEIQGMPFEIKGTYFVESGAFQGWMELYHADGDSLLTVRGQEADYISFWIDYNTGVPFGDRYILSTDFLSDEELVEYLTMYVEDAGDLVKNRGMKALVTGEQSFINHEGLCRDVWLGTDHAGNFVKEIRYTIGASGIVYEFHVPSDDWDMVFVPSSFGEY